MSAEDESTAAMLTAAHLTIEELANAFDGVVSDAVSVKAEHELAFIAGFGWWGKISRTARSVSLLVKAGLASESTPLTRVIAEHTLALKWLLDGAPETVLALEEEGLDNQRLLIKSAAEAEWALPDWVSTPELPPSGDEDPLRGEFTKFLRLTQLYGEEVTYVTYRLMSADVHPSAIGSKAFLHEQDGKISLQSSPEGDELAPLTHAAYCLFQTTMMVDPLLADSPLQSAINRAELLFGTKPPVPKRVPEKEKPARKAPTRVQITAEKLSDAQAVASIVFAALTQSGGKLGQESVSQRKSRVMVEVESLPPAPPASP